MSLMVCHSTEWATAYTERPLDLGTREQTFHGDFDGRRRKRVLVKIMGQ